LAKALNRSQRGVDRQGILARDLQDVQARRWAAYRSDSFPDTWYEEDVPRHT
jgi:hypothetical protein